MGKASGVKFFQLDHDTHYTNEAPPVQNTWYENFQAYDVRLIWCLVYQSNDETVGKELEIRWTIDGNVYFGTITAADNTLYYVYRGHLPSAAGTAGLEMSAVTYNAANNVDKRGQDFKVEVRIVSPLGTNQILRCWSVEETLEVT